MPPARLALNVATVGVLAVSGYAVLVRPPPFGWALVSLCFYVALLLGGVLALRWRTFVDAIVLGPRGSRGVVLTFDDGPSPGSTLRVLDALAARGVTATFFLVGRKAELYPEVVRAIVDGGHTVGLHCYAHDRLFALRSEQRVREDLQQGVAALEQITGRRPLLFRPPRGHTNPIIARAADALGLVVVGWTIGGRDRVSSARPEDVVIRVRRDLRDGAIVLLHDASERDDREPAALGALPALLDAIAASGLEVVPLSTWVSSRDTAP